MTSIVTTVGALLAGVAGCSWLVLALWRLITGERAGNAAISITGAAKLMVDELQEEVHAARAESRLAREETRQARAETAAARDETEMLRRDIAELRRLTGLEIERLRAENGELVRRLANGRPGGAAGV
jgi:hypothetical protein